MKIVRIIICVFLCFSIVFSLSFGMWKIGENKKVEEQKIYEGIISLWQVDTFEGGKGSRKQFLLNVAREFEKNNKGVLIMVTNMTVEGACEKFKENIYPDMISFSLGVLPQNANILNNSVDFNSGKIENKTYALPWCNGYYYLIAKNKEDLEKNEIKNLILSKNDYTIPLLSLLNENIKIENIKEYKPMDAYLQFVGNKNTIMLGTQRDIVRLSNRGENVFIKKLVNFSDLIQYISVTSDDKNKIEYSNQFINFLLSEKIQKTLTKLSMFSPYYQLNFEENNLNLDSHLFFKSTISAFTDTDTILSLQKQSLEYFSKNIEIENILKKILL